MENIIYNLHKTPRSFLTYFRIFGGVLYSQERRKKREANVSARREGAVLSSRFYSAFCKICDIEETDNLNPIYPATIVYPYMMHILSSRHFPFSVVSILNIRTTIAIGTLPAVGDLFDTVSEVSELRQRKKGVEVDITSSIYSDNKPMLHVVTTYLAREAFIPGTVSNGEFKSLKSEDNAKDIAQWYLPAKNRWLFGKICGDTNGIHKAAWYARLFGFKRDFAQPLRVLAKCMDSLSLREDSFPMKITYDLKGPVYYNNTLYLKGNNTGDLRNFQLYCGDNPRPCICGVVEGPHLS